MTKEISQYALKVSAEELWLLRVAIEELLRGKETEAYKTLSRNEVNVLESMKITMINKVLKLNV